MSKQNDEAELEPRRCAFFFDVDGTLAEIQPRPELVSIPPRSLAALQQLHREGVPVAVISGRPIEQLDALLQPLVLPAAGIHGAQRRTAGGTQQNLALDEQTFATVQRELAQACGEHPGLSLENKGVAFALHYRLAPELEETARALAEAFVKRYAEVLALQPGKCVFELKPRGASKGEVIRSFMREAPFSGRTPVFLGDDLTDEAGFAVVNELGGVSIKVGSGATEATQRLASVAAVTAWLEALQHALSGQQDQSIKPD
ncbi:trehalose-phosphatase [Pseudomonas sp. PS1]|uniref:Trehalose 6-phosphate phosphatase n=1 Tax=Stutzerimonas marianensis TaxID=2929513 RepID=A0A9X1W8X7_9GAMM|nr:trehalose-phosphatase [Pseudomonas marianensis]MCJ0975854.1 trehalose-phosphatase [Pseudomonas marianensis]